MKASFLLLAAVALTAWQANAGRPPSTVTNAPTVTALADQFDRPQQLRFPNDRVVLLTIADHKGYADISPWITSVRDKFASRVSFCGIADLSSVPSPFRANVRKKFQKSQSYPVMLDWSGAAVKSFGYVPSGLEVILLDRTGKVIQRWRGEVTAEKLAQLHAALQQTTGAG